MNETILSGIISQPELHHTINNTNIYAATLFAPRTSGTLDQIPILLPEELLPDTDKVLIKGEFRSHNTPDRHIKLYVYVTEICPTTDLTKNQITVEGYICKTPVCRTTPKGKTITDILLATPRQNIRDRSDYLPIVVWENKSDLKIGDKILITGRIQSREHKKGIAYEISSKTLTQTQT